MCKPTVHVVDDDQNLRAALIRLFESVGLAAFGHEDGRNLSNVRRRAPACIILDLRLGAVGGLAVQEELRSRGITIPVLFLTGVGSVPMAVQAMRGGAFDVLTKPVEEEALLAVVRRALEADAVALARDPTHDELKQRFASLTPRERDVMLCAIGGLMNKQIAAELNISEVTAKVNKRHMMRKMQAESLADLVRQADRIGVVATRKR